MGQNMAQPLSVWAPVETHLDQVLHRNRLCPQLAWHSGLSSGLRTTGLLVRFPVRAHAWVSGQVPSRGHVRGSPTVMFLSLCL